MYWNVGGIDPNLIKPVSGLGILRGDKVYYDKVSADEDTWQNCVNPASANFRWRVLEKDPENTKDEDTILRLSLDTERGVRPVINIDLTEVLLTSTAGFKESASVGEDALVHGHPGQGYPRDVYPREWKLTLKDGGPDGNHSGFTASRTDGIGEVRAGDKIVLSYTGARTGKSEYISVFLCPGLTGSILCYGHLAKTEGGSADSPADGVPLIIPKNTREGNYTLGVFAEQLGGEYNTDYAGDVVLIPLVIT